MKNKLVVLPAILMTLLFSAFSAFAQDSKKITAVVNKAEWCPVCQLNGEKIMKEVIPVFNQSNVHFMMNDLTNDATKADSKMMLEKGKAYKAVKKTTATGLILLIDESTGKLVGKISVAEPGAKIIEMIKKVSVETSM